MSNPMLAWYESDILDQIPETLSLDPAYEIADDLTFRDVQGAWWRPQRDESWIRYNNGEWVRADRPDALEGTTPLPVGIAASASAWDEAGEPTSPDGPADALERRVARIAGFYRSGAMVSTMAELTLSDRKLIADDGTLWTVGAQSGAWHRYGEKGWELGERPEGNFLADDEARSAAQNDDGPFQRWAEIGPLLPESITAPWDAPDPPDALVEASLTAKPAAPPAPPPPAAPTWSASHSVPAEGLQAWASPDPAGAVIASLAGGVELRVEDRRADWAHVTAHNGWQGWVDGRRLRAAAPAAPPPPPPSAPSSALPPWAPASANAEMEATPAGVSDAMRARPISRVAAIVLLLSAFIPWWGEGLEASQTSLFHVWDGSYERGLLTIGRVMLLIGIGAVATVFSESMVRYRKPVAGVAVGVSVVWLLVTYVYLAIDTESLGTAFAEMATYYFAPGPWVALAAGVALFLKRWS